MIRPLPCLKSASLSERVRADDRLAKEEDDPLDRYPPIVRYLQKLGPDHLKTIFDFSKWIFAEDPKRGLNVCYCALYGGKIADI
jgi:hypothetical protein